MSTAQENGSLNEKPIWTISTPTKFNNSMELQAFDTAIRWRCSCGEAGYALANSKYSRKKAKLRILSNHFCEPLGAQFHSFNSEED